MTAKVWAIVAIWVFYGAFVAFCGIMTQNPNYTLAAFLGGLIPAGIATTVIRSLR